MMLHTSVVLASMHVIVGESRPVERFTKMPRQCGSPCAILLMCFGLDKNWVGISTSRMILTCDRM